MTAEIPTAGSSPTALVVSGSGHWADPWHPYPATSQRLAELIRARGITVTVSDEVEAALVGLQDEVTGVDPGGPTDAATPDATNPDAAASSTGLDATDPAARLRPDLLVLNVGNTDGPSPDVPSEELGDPPSMPVIEAVLAGIRAHLQRGGALLAIHSAATALATQEGWSRLLGGRWVRGTTMHPPIDRCTVDVPGTGHPVTRGLADFEVVDERYSWLHTEDDITVLASHTHAGERHPLVWAREQPGGGPSPGRVLYDALGHDERSYDSPDHLRLLEQGVDWLLHRSD